MADPVVTISSGVPVTGTGTITTLGLTIPPAATSLGSVQGGPMCQGSVVTSAPTYTNATINALTLDTSGRLQAFVATIAATNTGFTQTRVVSAASTNATSLKASAGNIAAIDLYNVAAYAVFFKLYNKASAPTVGTDTPIWTIPIPANGSYSTEFPIGEYFSTGIAFAITKLQADSDTTVIAASDVTGRIKWI
jgi:hypothetical protein